jgi:hypothetical protein
MRSVARFQFWLKSDNNDVNQLKYVETSVRNKCLCSFYCALITVNIYGSEKYFEQNL